MNKKLLVVISVIVVALLVALYYFGVGSSSKIYDSSKVSQTGNKGLNVSIAIASDPINAYIGIDGGSVSLDGIELDFAKGSVIGGGNIVMESIDALKGLTEGVDFVSGVHVTAENILLTESANISFDIPAGLEVDDVVGFSYFDEGRDFHQYPIEIIGDMATMKVSHFSGYGILLASEEFTFPDPSSYEAAAKSKIAEILRELERRQIAGTDADYEKTAFNETNVILKTWFKSIMDNYAEPALRDNKLLMRAITEYIRWKDTVFHIPDAEAALSTEISQMKKVLIDGVKNGGERAISKCSEEKDPEQAAQLLSLYGLTNMFGEFDGIDNTWLLDGAKACAQFTLVIDTVISEPEFLSGCNDLVFTYHGEIPLTIDNGSTFGISGSGEVKGNIKITGCNAVCTVDSGTLTQKISIPSVEVHSSEKSSLSFLIEVTDDHSYPEMTCSETYGNGNSFSTGVIANWSDSLFNTELPMIDSEHFVLDKWDIVKNGDVYAQKVFDIKVPDSEPYPQYEKTTYKLIHTPQ